MSVLPGNFDDVRAAWRKPRHTGENKPAQVVEVRKITMGRGYQEFGFLSGRKREKMGEIVGGHNADPWQGHLIPQGPWIELPNIMEVQIDGELNQGSAKGGLSTGQSGSGFFSATIKIENIVFQAVAGAYGAYHAIQRGYLSPYLGYYAHIGAPIRQAIATNEWFEVLAGGYQVRVWQGYGINLLPVFTGVIDDADLDSNPDFITVTARDFGGRFLSDQYVYGENKAKEIRSPITFYSGNPNKKNLPTIAAAKKNHWIHVSDAADVIRWCFMWAGFHEWYVEDMGTDLTLPITFHQSDTLLTIIEYITAQGNFVFYMDCPTSQPDSIGVPVFRECHALAAPSAANQIVTENDLLTAVEVKHTTDPLAWLVRARGAPSGKASATFVEGDDPAKRFSADYYPPWSGKRKISLLSSTVDGGTNTRLAGTRKYEQHIEVLLNNNNQCLLMAVMIAYQEALASTEATFSAPALPPAHAAVFEDAGSLGFHLDGQVTMIDTGTGTTSRVWIRKLSSVFTAGEQPNYSMTIQGSLLDTPDLELLKFDYDEAMRLAGRTQHHPSAPAAGGGGAGTGGAGSGGFPGGGEELPPVGWGPLPSYPRGPLGEHDPHPTTFTVLHRWNAHGSLGDFTVPAGEGRLKVAEGDGRLCSYDPLEVNLYDGEPSWTHIGLWPDWNFTDRPFNMPTDTPPPGFRQDGWWMYGDKYAAQWTAPDPTGAGHKIRAHLLLSPTPNDYAINEHAIVVNLTDRQHGLAFFFGFSAIGWTEDLRPLNTQAGYAIALNQAQVEQGGRSGLSPLYRAAPGSGFPDELLFDSDGTWHTRPFSREQHDAQVKEGWALQTQKEVWVEVWRKRDSSVVGALYHADPATGATPKYVSTFIANSDGDYGPDAVGHFGWVMSYQIDGNDQGYPPDYDWPFPSPHRGILDLTLFGES